MLIQKNKLGSGRWEVVFEPESAFWRGFVEQAEQKLSRRNIAGFRPGKAPKEAIYAHFGEEAIFDEAFGLAFSALYQKVVEEAALKPVLNPVVLALEKNLAKPKITLLIITRPEVILGDYQHIKIKREKTEVAEGEVEELLASLRRQKAVFKAVEREAKIGDLVEIDFEGFVEGKPLPGGASKNHPLILGEKIFIPGFEENLVGLKKGEEKELVLVLPANFKVPEFAGQEASFKVRVQAVKEVILPELDDEFAAEFDQPTLTALRVALERFIKNQKERELKQKYQELLVDALIETARIDLPPELIEAEEEALRAELETKTRSGLSLPASEKIKALAERRLRAGLIIEEISQKEGVQLAEGEIEKEIEHLKEHYPKQKREIELLYRTGQPQYERLKRMLVGQKTIDRLLERSLL